MFSEKVRPASRSWVSQATWPGARGRKRRLGVTPTLATAFEVRKGEPGISQLGFIASLAGLGGRNGSMGFTQTMATAFELSVMSFSSRAQ